MKLGRDIGKICMFCKSLDVMIYLFDGTGFEDYYCKDCLLKTFETEDLLLTNTITREASFIIIIRRACFGLVRKFEECKHDPHNESMLLAKFHDCVILNLKLLMKKDYDSEMLDQNLPMILM